LGRNQTRPRSLGYKIIFSHPAEKKLYSVPKSDQKKIVNKIERLKTNPFSQGYEKSTGMENCYRIRKRDYRIIYTIKDSELIILILNSPYAHWKALGLFQSVENRIEESG